MILYICQITTIVFALLMFVVNPKQKVGILLATALCLHEVQLSFIPVHGARIIICLSYILSEIKNLPHILKIIKQAGLPVFFVLVIIAWMILCLTSPHILTSPSVFLSSIISELLLKYFVIIYVLWSIKNDMDLRTIFNIAFPALLILTFFGILNFIENRSLFMNEVGGYVTSNQYVKVGERYETSIGDRFRVQSMFALACNYGYVCMLMLLFSLLNYYYRTIGKLRFTIALVSCLFGIVACGFRTCLISGFISVLSFYYFMSKNTRIRNMFVFSFMFIVLYIFLPPVQYYVDIALSAFGLNKSASGSSIEMREIQFLAVLYHIRDHFLFGRGFNYFSIDMGWAEGNKSTLVDADLQGLEGHFLTLLLERGIWGIVCYVVLLMILVRICMRNIKYDRIAGAFLLSTIIAYFTYANMTGEQGSAFITMLFIGLGLKILYSKKAKVQILQQIKSIHNC